MNQAAAPCGIASCVAHLYILNFTRLLNHRDIELGSFTEPLYVSVRCVTVVQQKLEVYQHADVCKFRIVCF